MPELDMQIGMHLLNIKLDGKPIKQPQRHFRPELIEAIEAKMKKLIDTVFIREEQHPPDQAANIAPMLKKNDKIWICVDFRDLNTACPKKEFPLLITDVRQTICVCLRGCLSWTNFQGTIRFKCILRMRNTLLLECCQGCTITQ